MYHWLRQTTKPTIWNIIVWILSKRSLLIYIFLKIWTRNRYKDFRDVRFQDDQKLEEYGITLST